jgi:hypothetical protein
MAVSTRYQQFNMDWDRKMGEYEHHANDLVDGMRQRHQVWMCADLYLCAAESGVMHMRACGVEGGNR